MQTYKHCWAACRVDYMGLAKACIAIAGMGSPLSAPSQVRMLLVDLLEPHSASGQLRWDERKWQQVLQDSRERELRMRLKAGASLSTKAQIDTHQCKWTPKCVPQLMIGWGYS
eukprot:1150314-Pelagomonas_calceolata.AAC.6